MKEALKKQIEEVLPELENALVKAGDIVVVNGVSIERFEAEKICVELKEELKSKIKKCKITKTNNPSSWKKDKEKLLLED